MLCRQLGFANLFELNTNTHEETSTRACADMHVDASLPLLTWKLFSLFHKLSVFPFVHISLRGVHEGFVLKGIFSSHRLCQLVFDSLCKENKT